VSAVVACPPVRPENPHRRQMRRRVRAIDAAVSTAQYNQSVRNVCESATIDATGAVGLHFEARGSSSASPILGTTKSKKPETMGTFLKDMSVGLDIRLMSLAGGVVGYYMCYIRGLDVESCIVGGLVGIVAMMLVDAVLVMTRMAKDDKTDRRRGVGNDKAAFKLEQRRARLAGAAAPAAGNSGVAAAADDGKTK
jgi:hypothetical protein